MVLETDENVSEEILQEIAGLPDILHVARIVD